MTTDQPTRELGWQLGIGSTLALGVVLLGWALSVNVPKVTGGFFSDFSTYYSMAYSIVDDFDFEYRREDLERVWREYGTGPQGIFLKRGRDVQGVRLTSAPPFFEIVSGDDWDPNRLYYAKSFIFPLFAAPFVWLFGTNGFFVLHALLLTACFACAYGFLVTRSAPVPSLIFAMAFLFMSVVPVYVVQYMPDFFTLAIVLIAYFFWAYKEAAAESTTVCLDRVRAKWVMSARSDLVAVGLLGLATFSKPTLVFVIAPMLVLFAMRKQWRRAVLASILFAAVIVGLFAANAAITGDWNYQGGDRRMFSAMPSVPGAKGGFPFQSESQTFDMAGVSRTTNRVPIEVLTGRDAFVEVFRRNLGYFFVGRHTGFVPYFFPGVAAMLLFLFSRRHPRRLWQWATLATALGSAVFLLLYMPFTYSGGGGPVGNRYFLGVYPLFLFVTPPLARLTGAVATAAIGALFTAQIVSNPFYATYHPGDHAKSGLYRLLPIELTLLNDLPMANDPPRVRRPLGGDPPVYIYFVDDNAYNPESDAFWVKGQSRADMVLRAPVRVEKQGEDEIERPLLLRRAVLELETGPVANRVTITTGADKQVVDLPANDKREVTVSFPDGMPYKPMPDLSTNYLYAISIASESFFVPMFSGVSDDSRYLGVRVRVTPMYE